MKALVFEEFGGPDVLQWREIDRPAIGPNEVLLKMSAIGLNYADIYRRKGNYHLTGTPPYILGYEGAGIVEEIGANVKDIKIGDRISFADVPFSNAEYVAVPVDHALPVPEELHLETAAAVMLQGLTAQYLTRDSYAIKQGDTVIIHAAAGGVGQLLVQITKMLGGRVLALTSTSEKAEAARATGADEVFLYKESWVQQVLDVTDGKGADAVFESVGATLMDSFAATRTGGTVIFYGMAGGDPESVDPRMLMDTSKTLVGGDLWNVLTSREERLKRSRELFDWLTSGAVKISTPQTFPLSEGADAHRLLESRKSTGKILLIP